MLNKSIVIIFVLIVALIAGWFFFQNMQANGGNEQNREYNTPPALPKY